MAGIWLTKDAFVEIVCDQDQVTQKKHTVSIARTSRCEEIKFDDWSDLTFDDIDTGSSFHSWPIALRRALQPAI
jgi:hypothetical protein